MIYLDNAATSLIKPKEVKEILIEKFDRIGNASRGFNRVSLDTSRMVLDTRVKLAKLFNIKDPRQISFTYNATESLNIAINSFISSKDHVITSVIEHNSVLRPLYLKEEEGASVSFLDIKTDKDRKEGILNYEDLFSLIRPNTKAIIISHASNVTGNITDLDKISKIARDNNLLFILDCAQTAGVVDIDVEKYGIDVLCFTGHKSLFAIQGVGGIYIRKGLTPKPIKVGGSGMNSYSKKHPSKMPDILEAGTLNSHAILTLNASLDFIKGVGIENIWKKENDLLEYFTRKLRGIAEVNLYGNEDLSNRVGILSLNIGGISSDKLAETLANKYDIATRSGAHCAPMMHKSLNTQEKGLVRFSVSYFTSKSDIDYTINALMEIIGELREDNN